jgi:small-conductance mechanosensitive channel
MPAAILPVAAGFWGDHRDEITAVVTILVAIALAMLIDRALVRRGAKLASVVRGGGQISAVTDTRLRMLRRLVFVAILVIGVALALMQFTVIKRTAAGVLASSAVIGLVVGFAARQTLANAVAGIMLAIVQPVRIGDQVTFEDQTGTVEDVGLTYTRLRTGADARILIPNERLAGGILRNDSIRSPTVAIEVSLWLAPDADAARALAAIEAHEGLRARIADSTHEGLRLLVMGQPGPPNERLAHEGDLRAQALEALRAAGVR